MANEVSPVYIICPDNAKPGWIPCANGKMLPPESTLVECKIATKTGIIYKELEWYSSWVSGRYLSRHGKEIDLERHLKNLHWVSEDNTKYGIKDVLAWKKETDGHIDYFSEITEEKMQQLMQESEKYVLHWGANFETVAKFSTFDQMDKFIKFLKDNKIPWRK